MDIRDYFRLLRTRWFAIVLAAAIGGGSAFAVSMVSTPMYAATTQLYVSTNGGASASDTYQGNLAAKQLVVSYGQLAVGKQVAERTIEELGLSLSPAELMSRVEAEPVADTVMLAVTVTDPDADTAALLSNTVSVQLSRLVTELGSATSTTVGPNNLPVANAAAIVVSTADVPSTPVSPVPVRTAAVGVVLGTILGAVYALTRGLLDTRIRDRSALETAAAAPVIGTVPLDKARATTAAIDFTDARSRSAEAYRAMRTNLQFLGVDHPPRAFTVTSSLAGEGKSTTAINIALALSESGNSVLLVDGDLRRPRIASYLGLVGTSGLSTVLSHSADIADVLQDSGHPGLTVMTSGVLPPNPSELFSTDYARQLVAELKSQFDYVVFDAAPLLPVTDGAVLSAITDGALVMARHKHVKRDQIARAVGDLRAIGATVLGTVLMMTPARGGDVYEYYGDRTQPKDRAPERPEYRDVAPVPTVPAATAGRHSHAVTTTFRTGSHTL